MKKIAGAFATSLFILFLSCQNDLQAPEDNVTSTIFHAGVGEPIPVSTATRWIEQYDKQLEGSRNAQTYVVTKPNLEAIMQSTADLIGFTFHHALDHLGEHHILIIPIDNTLSLWTSSSQRIALDANTNTEIDIDVAHDWTDRYAAANPGGIRYHFFGADIFSQIVQSPEFRIEEAINDEQVPQLLLIVPGGSESSGTGRINSEDEVYDASVRCPTHCV